MRILLPLVKQTPGTVVFGNQADKTLPVNTVYVRKGSVINGKPVEDLKEIYLILSVDGDR